MGIDPSVNIIKRTIHASFPDAEISIINNPRDSAGSMIYVRNVPEDFSSNFQNFMDFVTVPIDSRNSDYMIIPLPIQEEAGPGL